jgi:hypothetical protein
MKQILIKEAESGYVLELTEDNATAVVHEPTLDLALAGIEGFFEITVKIRNKSEDTPDLPVSKTPGENT